MCLTRRKSDNMKEKVIDLSAWNIVKSYDSIKAAGIKYTILKAINKNLNPDKQLENHFKGCNEAGIKVIGTYHYSYAKKVKKAKEAARAWIKTVNGRCNMFFLDWEDASLPKDSKAVDIINAYADEVHRAGHEIAIYCGLSWYNNYIKKYADKLRYDFWIARYYAGYKEFSVSDAVNEKYMPAIAHNLMGWQYTSSGSVQGISGNVDINLWYKNIVLCKNLNEITIDFNPFPEPTQIVKLKSKGDDVKWVQWFLWRFGIINKSGIDGIFGINTYSAVVEAQNKLGLAADGIVGKRTKNTFKKVC